MKIHFAFLTTVLLITTTRALAQEYQGNFWINPQTRQVELLNSNSGNLIVQNDRWVELAATAQGGDRILVDTLTRRDITSGRYAGTVRFHARTISARGDRKDYESYIADCQNFDLTTSDGIRIPITSGTVSEALYRWACPSQ